MSLSARRIADGIDAIGDQEYGWAVATIHFSTEGMEELDEFELQDAVERFADWIGGQLNAKSEARI